MGRATQFSSLVGQLLVAMPGMRDPRFAKTVVYMCAHGPDGAMGLVVNRALESLTFRELLEQLGINSSSVQQGINVHFGGPVDTGRGFVLHSPDYRHDGTLVVANAVALTATVDIYARSQREPARACIYWLWAMPAGDPDSSTARCAPTAGCT